MSCGFCEDISGSAISSCLPVTWQHIMLLLPIIDSHWLIRIIFVPLNAGTCDLLLAVECEQQWWMPHARISPSVIACFCDCFCSFCRRNGIPFPAGPKIKKACGELHLAPVRHTAVVYVNEKIRFVIMDTSHSVAISSHRNSLVEN